MNPARNFVGWTPTPSSEDSLYPNASNPWTCYLDGVKHFCVLTRHQPKGGAQPSYGAAFTTEYDPPRPGSQVPPSTWCSHLQVDPAHSELQSLLKRLELEAEVRRLTNKCYEEQKRADDVEARFKELKEGLKILLKRVVEYLESDLQGSGDDEVVVEPNTDLGGLDVPFTVRAKSA
ncbi:hypothetical protein K435DRAFT_969558 [Dendrothele bispora CBS 962.96]|uniref:Uncharacterized protein n=1 Tax=Dendrothele bispora (strain CBS 962.96) TaxID=1314807 RepID=A0A4S8LGV4_DENBC|nr:hypothetical protein K435DRAFT_969558 [Dendrothele bispora CBS 962.96]